MHEATRDSARTLLKADALGSVSVDIERSPAAVVRDTRTARRGLVLLARRLARREAQALERLSGIDGVPRLIEHDGCLLVRTLVPGRPMPEANPRTRVYYASALRLLRRMHAAGVVHNDVAKEANWICLPDGRAGVVDFQLACVMPRRGRWFRLLAREDLRHMLKHKRFYASELLTARERAILAAPAWPARAWRRLIKPVYLAVTRRALGWPERTGPEERQRLPGK